MAIGHAGKVDRVDGGGEREVAREDARGDAWGGAWGHAWLAELALQASEAFATVDEGGRVNWVNDAAVALLASTRERLLGASVADLVHPEDRGRAAVTLAGIGNGARPRGGMTRLRAGDGSWRALEVTPAPIELPSSRTADAADGGVGPPRRITMVTLRDNLLQEAHWNFLAALSAGEPFAPCVDGFARGLSNSTDGPLAITFDHEGGRAIGGQLPPVLAGVGPDGKPDLTPGTPWAAAMRSGSPQWARVADLPEPFAGAAAEIDAAVCVVVPVLDPTADLPILMIQWPPVEAMAPVLLEALVRKPTQALTLAVERRDAIERLEQLAHHDALSGLANRERFFESLSEMSAAGHTFGICYIDLDLFKDVNDTLGHLVGDAVIEACGRRLKRLCRPGDLAARIGGDEFALACPDADVATIERIAARVITALSAPISVSDHVVRIGATVGCALSDDAHEIADVVAAADAELYRAKRLGRNRWSRAGAD